ncbi:hypothetical protein G6F62_010751 [Rhizopus arrhizus]|nr:hypothetical protein G6F62_010751 [Rhizopus arrhizus]KAG1397725.1 hypothetical protein G6F58_011465 [Rhizopus delemar]
MFVIALMLTGLIWSRYSMVIKPKNYTLFTVNIFVFATGAMQVGRIFNYRMSDEYKQKQESLKIEEKA